MPEMTMGPLTLTHPISWERYIRERGRLLIKWRGNLPLMKTLADKWIYIRVSGDKYRSISIHPDNPCGSLRRLNGSGNTIGGTKRFDSAVRNTDAADAANAIKPGNKKPEHVVQAGLIHHALRHDMRLDSRLSGFSGFFDELIFVTDEMKAGDIRADMIALGKRDGKFFPVFIELKATRSFDCVINQLIVTQQETAKVKSVFVEMLANATGETTSNIFFDEYKLVVIWPEAPSGNGIASAAKAVVDPRFDSGKGHFLLGEFPIPKVARDGFDSVIQFVESA